MIWYFILLFTVNTIAEISMELITNGVPSVIVNLSGLIGIRTVVPPSTGFL